MSLQLLKILVMSELIELGVYRIYFGNYTQIIFPAGFAGQRFSIRILLLDRPHRHLSNIDCLMACTACLVCFIRTGNGRSKKRSLGRLALVEGTQRTLSNLFWRLSISMTTLNKSNYKFDKTHYLINLVPMKIFTCVFFAFLR